MIQAIGRYLPKDANGYLLNDAHWDKVPPHWQEVLAVVVAAYREHLGDRLHSIYLRGSVAVGMGIDGVSDLDTFAVVYDESLHWHPLPWGQSLEAELRRGFSFVREVEIMQSGLKADGDLVNPFLRSILKLQSICLWGDDLIPQLPQFKPTFVLARSYRWLSEEVAALREPERLSEADIKALLKGLLRSGFELVLEREGQFTTDLYPCYRSFSKYYPEWEPEMRKALSYFLQVPTDRNCLVALADGLGMQLIRWFKDSPRITQNAKHE